MFSLRPHHSWITITPGGPVCRGWLREETGDFGATDLGVAHPLDLNRRGGLGLSSRAGDRGVIFVLLGHPLGIVVAIAADNDQRSDQE